MREPRALGRHRRAMRAATAVLAGLLVAVVSACQADTPRGSLAADAASAAIAPMHAHGGTGVSPGYGVFLLDDLALARELALWQELGMRWLRMDLDFSAIGEVPGSYDWTAPDRVVAAARRHGLEVIGVLTKAPPWAYPDDARRTGGGPDLGAFEAFAHAAVDRYASTIDVWEVWNEPNSATFWPDRPNAAAYAALLRVTATTIRAEDPVSLVLTGGLARDVGSSSTQAPDSFLRTVYAEGGRDWFDGVAAHPYSYPHLPSSDDPQNPFRQVYALRDVMLANGDGDKLVWLTEFGAPTGSSARAVSARWQARILDDATRVAGTNAWMGPLLLYSGRDRGTDARDLEQNFGLVTHDFTAKPALNVMREAG